MGSWGLGRQGGRGEGHMVGGCVLEGVRTDGLQGAGEAGEGRGAIICGVLLCRRHCVISNCCPLICLLFVTPIFILLPIVCSQLVTLYLL